MGLFFFFFLLVPHYIHAKLVDISSSLMLYNFCSCQPLWLASVFLLCLPGTFNAAFGPLLSLTTVVVIFYRTRYFSTPRKGHNPLQGRAYYQLLECLGVWLYFFLQQVVVQCLLTANIIYLHFVLWFIISGYQNSFPHESPKETRLVRCPQSRNDKQSSCCCLALKEGSWAWTVRKL